MCRSASVRADRIFTGRLVLPCAERDGVSAGLGHSRSVDAENGRRRGQQRNGLLEDGAVPGIEPAGDQPGQLDMRQLVPADRHDSATQAENVGRLVHRIGQQQSAQ